MFRTAAKWVAENYDGPFWWHEPDCIPLKKGWLEAIQAEYDLAGRPFLGTVVQGSGYGDMVNGVAVYPQDTHTRFSEFDFTSSVPWDAWMSPRIMGDTHNSKLVQHFFGQHDMAPTFALFHTKGEPVNTFSLEQIRPAAVVFHRNKDGTLLSLLRKIRPMSAPKPTVAKPAPISNERAYYHSGNLGDVIYSLAAVRDHGGGKLLLGPEYLHTAICDSPISRNKFELLKPLLDQQRYLTGSEFATAHPRRSSVHDLNQFRSAWNSAEVRAKTGIRSLCKMHYHVLGITDRFSEADSWLTVDDPIHTDRFVIHRSPRYRNPDFPWSTVYAQLRGKLLFVGLPQEHTEFEATFGRVAYWKPYNFLEMAQLIAGSLGYIGNQSFPMSIALGLGVNVCQESWPQSPDCVFARPNFLTQPFTREQFLEWTNV